jgi:hypothetical protein
MNANFLASPVEAQERKLELEVFGEVLDISTQAIQLA